MRNRQLFKWIGYACIFLLAFLLQTTALSRLEIMKVHPNLIPVVVVCVAIFEGPAGGAAFGFAAGLVCDALIPPSEAFFAVFFLFMGLLTGRVCNYIFKKRMFTALFWSLICMTALDLLYFCVFYLLPGRAGISALYTVALPETVFSVVFAPAVYLPVRAVYRRFGENNQ